MTAKVLNLLVCAVIFMIGVTGCCYRFISGLFRGAFDGLIDGDDDYDSY